MGGTAVSGFIAMQREALEHPLFKGNPDRFYAWFWLVAKAAWKPIRFDLNGRTITIQRGELCYSRSQLAAAWKWSGSAVERFLTRLETEQMIGRATGQGRTIITISNYSKYQDIKDEAGQVTGQVTGQRPDSDRTAKEPLNHSTIDKEDKSSSSNKRARKDFVLPDWVPVEPWDGYCAMRKAIKKPLTDRAKVLAINNLDRLRNEGHDPARVLDQSTAASWQGLFAVKGDYDGRNNNQRGGHNGVERDNRTGFERACDRIIEQSADSDQRREDAGAGSNRLLPTPDSPAML